MNSRCLIFAMCVAKNSSVPSDEGLVKTGHRTCGVMKRVTHDALLRTRIADVNLTDRWLVVIKI